MVDLGISIVIDDDPLLSATVLIQRASHTGKPRATFFGTCAYLLVFLVPSRLVRHVKMRWRGRPIHKTYVCKSPHSTVQFLTVYRVQYCLGDLLGDEI